MGGFEPTHIRIPKNDADFEIKSVVLFKGILKDPSVKRLGRSGQGQHGVDVIGYRGSNVDRLVGIQCKLKGPKQKLTEKEVREEVGKALKYKPALSEYFIITSAPNDTALDQLAQTLSRQQKAKGRKHPH
jgi:Restriction endonuclease